jgi:hypothetical protein
MLVLTSLREFGWLPRHAAEARWASRVRGGFGGTNYGDQGVTGQAFARDARRFRRAVLTFVSM